MAAERPDLVSIAVWVPRMSLQSKRFLGSASLLFALLVGSVHPCSLLCSMLSASLLCALLCALCILALCSAHSFCASLLCALLMGSVHPCSLLRSLLCDVLCASFLCALLMGSVQSLFCALLCALCILALCSAHSFCAFLLYALLMDGLSASLLFAALFALRCALCILALCSAHEFSPSLLCTLLCALCILALCSAHSVCAFLLYALLMGSVHPCSLLCTVLSPSLLYALLCAQCTVALCSAHRFSASLFCALLRAFCILVLCSALCIVALCSALCSVQPFSLLCSCAARISPAVCMLQAQRLLQGCRTAPACCTEGALWPRIVFPFCLCPLGWDGQEQPQLRWFHVGPFPFSTVSFLSLPAATAAGNGVNRSGADGAATVGSYALHPPAPPSSHLPVVQAAEGSGGASLRGGGEGAPGEEAAG